MKERKILHLYHAFQRSEHPKNVLGQWYDVNKSLGQIITSNADRDWLPLLRHERQRAESPSANLQEFISTYSREISPPTLLSI